MISYTIGVAVALAGIWIFNPALTIIGMAICLPTITKHLSGADHE